MVAVTAPAIGAQRGTSRGLPVKHSSSDQAPRVRRARDTMPSPRLHVATEMRERACVPASAVLRSGERCFESTRPSLVLAIRFLNGRKSALVYRNLCKGTKKVRSPNAAAMQNTLESARPHLMAIFGQPRRHLVLSRLVASFLVFKLLVVELLGVLCLVVLDAVVDVA